MSIPGTLSSNKTCKFLVFDLGGFQFALPINYIREIMEFIPVDPLTMTPDYLLGAINLRGEVVPVIDLAIRLQKPIKENTNKTCIIICEYPDKKHDVKIGFKVDMVTKVTDIKPSQIESVPTIGGQLDCKYLFGLARMDKRLLSLLDIEKLIIFDNNDEQFTLSQQLELIQSDDIEQTVNLKE